MYSLLPDMTGKVVLDLGCGAGDECMKMITMGAEKVVGIDASYGMIQEAKSKFGHIQNIQFLTGDFSDLAKLNFEPATFEFVYSSLALHYEKNLSPIFSELKKYLKPKAKFLFSLNHPVVSSWEVLKYKGIKYDGLGKVTLENGEEKYLGRYFDFEMHAETWFEGKFNYNYFHHTFESTVNSLITSGFQILKVLEPQPIKKADKGGADSNKFNNKFFKIPKAIIYLAEIN